MKNYIIIALTLLTLFPAFVTPLQLTMPPRVAAGEAYALNWAGYADVVHSGSVTYVNASWIVPSVSPSQGLKFVAIWVGIDGFNDSTVEQTGILAETYGGKVYYSAWYEFYPAASVSAPSSDVVKAGDLIVAWVQYNPGSNTFTTVLRDVTEGWTFSSPATSVPNAYRSSAEWIVERPAIGNSLTQLANFNTAYFGPQFTGMLKTDYAIINGNLGHMGSSGFNLTSITMVNMKGQILAAPSTVYHKTSFYVTWYASG
ncbi:MAG: G1 family glutamic endopeptidase [Nitrososphaeria archaeon]